MKPPLWKAALASALLGLLFLFVYSLTNHLAGTYAGVPSINLPWESRTPFVPLFIIPYMSIDLFFLASPFRVKSNRELAAHSRRLAAAIVIAGIFFLFFPLQFAYPRPHVDGFLGLIFNNFRTLDLPFNEFPSLHIALCLILADFYLRHCRGAVRAAAALWFALIFVSPIFTWQHHVLDILGGIALGAVCVHFVSGEPLCQPFIPNPRIAAWYACGAVLLALLSTLLRPWSYLLLWPATSCALAASAYLFVGPGIYRKSGGRLPWPTWFFLWPVLLGQRLSLIHYARACRPTDALTDRVWIGRRLSGSEAADARTRGITAVLDLTCEFSESQPFRNLPCLHCPILDLTAPTPAQIEQALAFIQEHFGAGIVYIHCKIGYSRTAAVAGAYLLASGRAASVEEAVLALRRARPGMIIRPEALRALQNFAAAHCPLSSA